MKRRLFNLAGALSLVLGLATAALWVRSYSHEDFVRLSTWNEIAEGDFQYNRLKVLSSLGGVQLWLGRGVASSKKVEPSIMSGFSKRFLYQTRPPHRYPYSAYAEDEDGLIGPAGGFELATSSKFERYVRFTAPMWFYCAAMAVLPTIWLWRWWRSRRLKARGLCPTCGYDLRATPDRCPECGATTAAR